MPTYTEDKLVEIIGSYHQVHAALNKLESALAKVDIKEYKEPGQDFIRDMAFCHRRMMETHIIYRSDVIEAEAILTPKIERYSLRPGLEVCGGTI